ncbi:hypothetical protein [Cutibacterium phage PAVL21]|nr:hypothetical protein [Cutibacterium phage PAVL21]
MRKQSHQTYTIHPIISISRDTPPPARTRAKISSTCPDVNRALRSSVGLATGSGCPSLLADL